MKDGPSHHGVGVGSQCAALSRGAGNPAVDRQRLKAGGGRNSVCPARVSGETFRVLRMGNIIPIRGSIFSRTTRSLGVYSTRSSPHDGDFRASCNLRQLKLLRSVCRHEDDTIDESGVGFCHHTWNTLHLRPPHPRIK